MVKIKKERIPKKKKKEGRTEFLTVFLVHRFIWITIEKMENEMCIRGWEFSYVSFVLNESHWVLRMGWLEEGR